MVVLALRERRLAYWALLLMSSVLALRHIRNVGLFFVLLPLIIAEFVKDRPEVDVSMMTRTSVRVREWIASQQYDVGIAEMSDQRQSINIQPIRLECVCALRKDDPLAEKEVLTPDDLDNAPMASLFREHFTYQDA